MSKRLLHRLVSHQSRCHIKQSTRCYNMPFVVEQEGNVHRTYDIFSRLMKDRIVCIMGPIDDHLSNGVIAQLLFLNSESQHKPIHMYINSPGGSVTAGLAIYDCMQYVRPQISTFCMGQAASMGSLLLCAGSAGHRYALPNTRIMTHQPLGKVSGQASDIQIHAEEILNLRKLIYRLYEHHTGQPIDHIEKTMDRDRFMSAQESLDFGLIDHILKPLKETQQTG